MSPQREQTWARLSEPCDLLIVGGGITGAGILREAARLGWKAHLVEQRDFAWGSSSRSSKLVHGGLRYLKQGDVALTWSAVRERERLLAEAGGLVDPLPFLVATRENDRLGRVLMRVGLTLYDLLAGRFSHRRLRAEEFRMLAPHVTRAALDGGFRYDDAQTDDARLVLRVLREAVADGALALNYVAAETLLLERGRVAGLALRDVESGRTLEARARVVVNATGAWADRLRGSVGGARRLRPLRGSHLVFPAWRLPVPQALLFDHPVDRRPVYALPWEGAALVGTTDLDHDRPLDEEPGIAARESAYLMEALRAHFPALELRVEDALASFSGVRPVVGGGQADPSHEGRQHALWDEAGLLTVTGGKLTTFRRVARDVLKLTRRRLPVPRPRAAMGAGLVPRAGSATRAGLVPSTPLPETPVPRRLLGRYGPDVAALVRAAQPGELETLAGTPAYWAELRWAARAEAVQHLDDLLLRRVRLGLLLPEGAARLLPRVRAICQAELGWDDARWEREETAYRALWRERYAPQPRVACTDGPT